MGETVHIPSGAPQTRMSFGDILRVCKTTEDNVHSICRFGSRVYGCATEDSDEDFLVILKEGPQDLLHLPNANIILHNCASFKDALWNQSLLAIECHYTPESLHLKVGSPFPYKLFPMKLLQRAIESSDSDYNKAKKLWESDPDKARKKLYHSLRVLLFAAQAIQVGRSTRPLLGCELAFDFGAANLVRMEILTHPSTNWTDYEHEFGSLRDKLILDLRTRYPLWSPE